MDEEFWWNTPINHIYREYREDETCGPWVRWLSSSSLLIGTFWLGPLHSYFEVLQCWLFCDLRSFKTFRKGLVPFYIVTFLDFFNWISNCSFVRFFLQVLTLSVVRSFVDDGLAFPLTLYHIHLVRTLRNDSSIWFIFISFATLTALIL